MSKLALAIHGGAGTILKSLMTPELEREYRSGLEEALKTGWEILTKGGSSLDAVEAAVCSLEDFHLFNAGRGSVFTHEGKNEMDAAIMDGQHLKAGAVAFVKNVKNPIKLARLVMERTEHVLLAGAGANQFAQQMNVEMADDAYFFTEHRYEQLLKARAEGVVVLDHTPTEQLAAGESIFTAETPRRGESESEPGSCSPPSKGGVPAGRGGPATGSTSADGLSEDGDASSSDSDRKSQIENRKSLGTVGAVACDSFGNLAAATSTGGMTNKQFGRIGDTPIIGSGTYADNATCAVSCTGHGEYFMLGVTAYDVAARMKYAGIDLIPAARASIDYLTSIDGEGGLIAVDALGNVTLPFNSEGMYRGWISDGRQYVEIYR